MFIHIEVHLMYERSKVSARQACRAASLKDHTLNVQQSVCTHELEAWLAPRTVKHSIWPRMKVEKSPYQYSWAGLLWVKGALLMQGLPPLGPVSFNMCGSNFLDAANQPWYGTHCILLLYPHCGLHIHSAQLRAPLASDA